MNSASTNTNWEMALDLLVARASLDNDLRLKLLSDPQNYCHAHGINLPQGTQIIFKSQNSHLVIKEIPRIDIDNAILKKVNKPLTTRPTVSSGNEVVTEEVIVHVLQETSTTTSAESSTVESTSEVTSVLIA